MLIMICCEKGFNKHDPLADFEYPIIQLLHNPPIIELQLLGIQFPFINCASEKQLKHLVAKIKLWTL